MRIQLIILTALLSLNAFAFDDKSMQELFSKYDAVMDQKKVELIDEVFTQKFINDSGGKKELTAKIKELPTPSSNKALLPKTKMSWKKGQQGNIYLAKVTSTKPSTNKSRAETHSTEYVVKEEDGKLKIDGTLSDGD